MLSDGNTWPLPHGAYGLDEEANTNQMTESEILQYDMNSMKEKSGVT